MDTSDETRGPLFASPSGVRKRSRNEAEWEKNVAKRRRNLGLAYTSHTTKKAVSGRTIGQACKCSKKCFDIVGYENIQQLFKDFWDTGDWDMQTAYLQKQTSISAVKRRRTNNPETQRDHTRVYYVTVVGQPVQVCKEAFASIHGIGRARLDRAQRKKTSTGVPLKDQRGKNGGKNGSHGKTDDSRTGKVLAHISSFPTISSHYSRKTSPNVQYLDTDVTSRRQMYKLYVLWLEENHEGEVPVSWHYYDDMLKLHFPKLQLYKPRTDTCRKCDTFQIKIKNPELSAAEKKQLETENAVHQVKASAGYELPKKLLTERGNNVMVVCMDLQQALPTPKVSTGIAFYKRKMWTYNFNIHNYRTGIGHMFIWDEVTANRGAIEISSCISKFVDLFVPEDVDQLVIFSDNCAGQNKNFILLLFYLSLIHKGRFKEITHIYYQSGHTYMAADRDFGLIEKNERKVNYIFTPDEHEELIRTTKRANDKPFVVTRMKQEDFKDWEQLRKHVVKRNAPNMRFSDCCYFRLSSDYKAGYGCGTSYFLYESRSDTQVRLVRGKGQAAESAFNLSSKPVPRKYATLLPLPRPKLEDLKVLVSELVPPYLRRRYWDKILGINESEDDEDDPEPRLDDDDEDENDNGEPLMGADLYDYDE